MTIKYLFNGTTHDESGQQWNGTEWVPLNGAGGGGGGGVLYDNIAVTGYTRDNHDTTTSLGNYCLGWEDGYLNFTKVGGGSNQYRINRYLGSAGSGEPFTGPSQNPSGSILITGTNTDLPDHFFVTQMIDGDLLVVTRKYGTKKFNYTKLWAHDTFDASAINEQDNSAAGLTWSGDPATTYSNDWQTYHLFETEGDFYHLTQVLQDGTNWYVYHWVFTTDLGTQPVHIHSWGRALLVAASSHSTWLRPMIFSSGTPGQFYTVQRSAAGTQFLQRVWTYSAGTLTQTGTGYWDTPTQLQPGTVYKVANNKPDPLLYTSNGEVILLEPATAGWDQYYRAEGYPTANYQWFNEDVDISGFAIPVPPVTFDAVTQGVGRFNGDWLVSGYRTDANPGASGIWVSVLYYGIGGWVAKWIPIHTYMQASGLMPNASGLSINNDDIHLHAQGDQAVLTMSPYVGSTPYPLTILLRAHELDIV